MDNAALLVSLICGMLVMGLISWGFQFYVVKKLRAAGQEAGRVVGRYSFIKVFAQGWQNAEALGISGVMMVWAVALLVTICLVLLVVVGLLTMPTPPA